jgi:hypothetical protein
MRTFGRIKDENGNPTIWVEVATDPVTGDDTWVWVTTLIQVLKLNLNEAPYNANYGINAMNSVITQTHPDYQSTITQQQFAPYFANLSIAPGPADEDGNPTYNVNIVTKTGAVIPTINVGVPG